MGRFEVRGGVEADLAAGLEKSLGSVKGECSSAFLLVYSWDNLRAVRGVQGIAHRGQSSYLACVLCWGAVTSQRGHSHAVACAYGTRSAEARRQVET